MTGMIDLDRIAATPLCRDPYDFMVVNDVVKAEALPAIHRDFPDVPGGGSHPPSELDIKGAFKALMDEMQSPAFRDVVAAKFGLDLTPYPTMYTVRGHVREKDGQIHTDSTTKIITILLYLNEDWSANEGGRLRILRNGEDLEDYVAEVEPKAGTLLIFRRSENSWHGHKPHSGPRRTIQMNFVTDQSVVDREVGRHRFSARLKKLARKVLAPLGA